MKLYTYLRDATEPRSRKWIVAAVVLAVLSVWQLVAAHGSSERERAAVRDREAAEAERDGVVVARDRALTEAAELADQIAKIKAIAPSAKPVETVRWRTREVPVVPGSLLAAHADELDAARAEIDALRADGDPCAGMYSLEECQRISVPREFRFSASGSEARLRSEAGTLFAAGEVVVYESGQEIARAPWDASLTDLRAAPTEAGVKRLGYYAGVQYGLAVDSLRSCAYYDECSTSLRAYGGPELRWKRLALRAGLFADSSAVGLDLSASWHGHK